MKLYGYNQDTTHQAIIFEVGSAADSKDTHLPDTPGLVVGSSEWGWISADAGRRICAALTYFSDMTTEAVEGLAREAMLKHATKDLEHDSSTVARCWIDRLESCCVRNKSHGADWIMMRLPTGYGVSLRRFSLPAKGFSPPGGFREQIEFQGPDIAEVVDKVLAEAADKGWA